MQRRGGKRLIRGVFAGSATTLLALAFHVAAGGTAPAPGVILGATAASIWLCVMLGSARLRVPVLAAGIAAAQVVLHWLFVVATGTGTAVGGPGPHDHAVVLEGLSAGQSMWWSHAAAGILTLAALTLGERVLARLAELATLAIRRVAAVLAPRAARPAARIRARNVPAAPAWVLLPSLVTRRGPPVAVV